MNLDFTTTSSATHALWRILLPGKKALPSFSANFLLLRLSLVDTRPHLLCSILHPLPVLVLVPALTLPPPSSLLGPRSCSLSPPPSALGLHCCLLPPLPSQTRCLTLSHLFTIVQTSPRSIDDCPTYPQRESPNRL